MYSITGSKTELDGQSGGMRATINSGPDMGGSSTARFYE